MRLNDSPQDALRITAALLVLFLLSTCYAIGVQQHFAIDGSHFFVELLRLKSFTYGVDFSRHHAHYVTQALTVALMKAGVTDVAILSWSFGVGLYLPLAAGIAVCAAIARKSDPRYLFFPLASLFGVSANHTFMIIHESHVTAALFWPLFFFVLLQRRFDRTSAALALALSLLFIRTYESVAILGTILVALLGIRIRESWREATGLTRTVWVLQLLIFSVGIAIAVHFSLNPRIPGNRADLFASFGRVLGHWPALMSLSFVGVIGSCLLIPGLAASRVFPTATVALGALAVAVGLSPVVAPEAMRPGLHHAVRSHLILMVPVLAFLGFLVMHGHLAVRAATWRRVAQLVIILALGQTTWQVLAAGQWSGFRRVFREELAAHRGATPFEETALARERFGIQLLRPMTWGWTQPTLSILWAPNKNVLTLILNPASESGRWQPFDPLNVAEIPGLEDYGFSYAGYRDSLKR